MQNQALQNYIASMIREERNKTLSKSDQIRLGDLIDRLEIIYRVRGGDIDVRFDFEYLTPTRFVSWRGAYDELSIAFDSHVDMTLSTFMEMCKETVGKTFQGYKGGDFFMTRETPIWVANYGNSGNTALIGVEDKEYMVILHTGWREY